MMSIFLCSWAGSSRFPIIHLRRQNENESRRVRRGGIFVNRVPRGIVLSMQPYQEKTFRLEGLEGFSEKQISEHLKLYAGYVKNTNKLTNKLAVDIARRGEDESNAIAAAELRRRLGFEFNGMRLHELYFEALGTSKSLGDGDLRNALAAQFGSFDAWLADFKKTGMMRGIGWAVLCRDSQTGNLFNVWVSDHEVGHLAGLPVILAMDVWEHAYAIDFLPTGRKEYIEVFFKNLNWMVVESRLK